MDNNFEKWMSDKKEERKNGLKGVFVFISVGIFLILIDWPIMGYILSGIGGLAILPFLKNKATEENYYKEQENKKNAAIERKAQNDARNAEIKKQELIKKQKDQEITDKLNEKIKIIDNNLNKITAIDFPKPNEFKSNVFKNEKEIIEKSNLEALHKFVKISAFLEDLHRCLIDARDGMRSEINPNMLLDDLKSKIEREKNRTLDEIHEELSRRAQGDFSDRSANGLLKKLVDISEKSIPVFTKEISQVSYLEAMANCMLIFLLNNKQILYFEILEIFDKLGALDSSWQKSMSEKMDRIENKLDLIIGGLLKLNNNFEHLIEMNDDIIKSLESIDSSIKANNLIQVITAYQTYKVNKNFNRLSH